MLKYSRACALLLLVGTAGCDGSHAMSPVAPAIPVVPIPPAAQTLFGQVSDAAFRPAVALVQVLDGPEAGQSVTSSADGRFGLTGVFASPWTLRVSKDGFLTATVTSSSNGRLPTAFVRLEAAAAPVSLAGDYTLTVSASDSCAGIPSELRSRTYPATIAVDSNPLVSPGTSLTLTVSGGSFLANQNQMKVGVAGGDVGFNAYRGEDFSLVEQVVPGTFVAVGGFAFASVGPSLGATLSAPFDGFIDYCVLRPNNNWNVDCSTSNTTAFQRCESPNHRLTLRRR